MSVTLVILRRWRKSGDIIALFREIPSDNAGYSCNSDEHVGQHGGANYYGVIQRTVPATVDEDADLIDELLRFGYRFKPIQRASTKIHEARRKTALASLYPVGRKQITLEKTPKR